MLADSFAVHPTYPYLQLNSLAIEFDRLDLKIDSDRGDERRRERVIRETQQQATLADTFARQQRVRTTTNQYSCG
jgi:hypothetical protein